MEGIAVAAEISAQRPGRQLVTAGRAAQPQIDPSRKERFQRAELLGDHQRRVIGQHDAARAHANMRGARRDMANDHRRRGAGHAGDIVMLRHPITVVAPLLGMLREIKEWRNASPAVPPCGIGQRSRTE